MTDLLYSGPAAAKASLLLAHGAGAGMDSPWMENFAALLAARGLAVVRFEFAYMAGRRQGVRKPPPKAGTLMGEYYEAIKAVKAKGRLLIGGKSMGGRVASLIADEMYGQNKIAGLVCLGYPFHPPEKPEQLRTAHLLHLECPTLICQGTRDPFGVPEEVAGYKLSNRIRVKWFEDGDHDLRPRKALSGITFKQHLESAADAVAGLALGQK